MEHYFDPNDVAKIYAEADKLIGEHCHWSLHCGGIIVYDDKVLKDILKDNQIKLTKYDVEEQNLIKIDLLCNRGLSQLWDIDKKWYMNILLTMKMWKSYSETEMLLD